ncbi:Periplasmic copper-binding protein (NosD) [uncultured archaeon]|nr:Periplasmic copper-binding protein (NosD) [uncultured archaeon]
MKWLIVLLLLSSFAVAQCIEATDGMKVNETVLFCSSTYDVPNGISVVASNIVLDCGTAVLRGTVEQSEIGLRLENVDNVTVRNCNVMTFDQGIFLKNVTNSLVENNAALKNRIGIRLLDAFENSIRDNNDKSFQLAVSAINSKYNVVIFGNKNVERGFCDVNACNEHRDMNPCEPGDFYCSKKCSPQTDADCGPLPVESPPAEIKEPVKTAEQIVKAAEIEVKQELEPQKVVEEKKPVERSLSLTNKLLIYAGLYILAFIVLQIKRRH